MNDRCIAYEAGFRDGQSVPADPPSSEQAWSDFWGSYLCSGISVELADDYVQGHRHGQVAGD